MTGKEWKRVYGSEERVLWVRRQPCVFCHEGPCDNAHITNGGLGRKADYKYIVPACHRCHTELDHGIGKKGMERKYNVSLGELARRTNERWEKSDSLDL
jgi:hypothetical protein